MVNFKETANLLNTPTSVFSQSALYFKLIFNFKDGYTQGRSIKGI